MINIFLTIYMDLSMKYKGDITYEIWVDIWPNLNIHKIFFISHHLRKTAIILVVLWRISFENWFPANIVLCLFWKIIFGILVYTNCLTYHFIINHLLNIFTFERSNQFFISISDNDINNTKNKSMNTKAAVKIHSLK